MTYCAVKLSPYGRRSKIAKSFELKNLWTLTSQLRSFDEPVLGALRPDSTSILSGNSSIILTTHCQCRTPSSSSVVSSQARPAAKQQVVLFFVSDHRSICAGTISGYKLQMKNLCENIKYRWRDNAGRLGNVLNWSIERCFECSFDSEMRLEMWWSSAASRVFNIFSSNTKSPHLIADIKIG
jgi:hypothetical protein